MKIDDDVADKAAERKKLVEEKTGGKTKINYEKEYKDSWTNRRKSIKEKYIETIWKK